VDGISMAATLLGKKQPERPFLYREFPAYGGQQMIRMGDWKLVRQNLLPAGGSKAKGRAPMLELFNLKADPAEAANVAAQHPDIVAKLEKAAGEQHVKSAEFPFAALD
jgi:arylsulfatase